MDFARAPFDICGAAFDVIASRLDRRRKFDVGFRPEFFV